MKLGSDSEGQRQGDGDGDICASLHDIPSRHLVSKARTQSGRSSSLTSAVVVAELKDTLTASEEVALFLLGSVGLVAKARGVAEEVVREIRAVGLAEALLLENRTMWQPQPHLHAQDLLVELALARGHLQAYLEGGLGVPNTEPGGQQHGQGIEDRDLDRDRAESRTWCG